MASVNFYQPRPQFFDDNGNPASNGRVSFFFPNTSTLKTVFTDEAQTVAATNPHILDDAGYVRDGGLYLGEGNYKVVFERSNNATPPAFIEEWTVDPVIAEGVSAPGVNSFAVIDNIASLKGLTPGQFDAVFLLGYYTKGDSGGGWFYWDADSTATDDAGSIITPGTSPATGRWIRIFDAENTNAAQWGAMTSSPATIDAQLLAMVDFSQNNPTHRTCVIPPGTYKVAGSFSLTGDVDLHIEPGAVFSLAAGTETITLSTSTVRFHGEEQLVGSNITLVWNPVDESDANILWWGAGDWPTWERATGNYNGRLVVSTPIIADGVVTSAVTHGPIHFETLTASIDFPTSAVFNLTSYTYEEGSTNLFIDDWVDTLLWVNQRDFRAEHFDVGPVFGLSGYLDLIHNITGDGAFQSQLSWGVHPLFELNFNLVSQIESVTMDVEQGTVIRFGTPATSTGGTWFGTVITPAGRRIFDTNGLSVGVPLLANNTVYAQWWGLKDGSFAAIATSNVLALDKAIQTSLLSNTTLGLSSWVSLDNALVDINSTITVDFSVAGKTLRIRDGSIRGLTPFTGTNLIEIANDFELNNISLFPATAAGTLRLFDSVADTLETARLSNCYLFAAASQVALSLELPSTANVSIQNTEFTGTGGGAVLIKATVGNPTQQYGDCRFTGSGGTNDLDGTTKALFSGCTFEGITTEFDASHLSNCNFIGSNTIQFNAGCSVVGGLFQSDVFNVKCLEGTERGVSFTGVIFRDGLLNIIDPTDVTVTGCSFNRITTGNNGAITLNGTSPTFTCKGVVIRNNVFRNSSTGTPDIVEQGANINSSGHIDCEVSENTSTGFAYTGTKFHFTEDFTYSFDLVDNGTQFTEFNFAVSNSWVILQKFSNRLANTYGGAVRAFDDPVTVNDYTVGINSRLDGGTVTIYVVLRPSTSTPGAGDTIAVFVGGTLESNNIASEDL